MDDNGFTGFNPEKAQIDIKNACVHLGFITLGYAGAYTTFFEEMYNYWCSPKAVEFYDTYEPQLREVADTLSRENWILYQNAARAYNRMAAENGCAPIQLADLERELKKGVNVKSPRLAEKSRGGIVGMNKIQAKAVLAEFEKRINTLSSALDEVPSFVAFYDDGGEMQHAFSQSLADLKSKMMDSISRVSSSMKSALETEVDRMELAKQQTTQTFNG